MSEPTADVSERGSTCPSRQPTRRAGSPLRGARRRPWHGECHRTPHGRYPRRGRRRRRTCRTTPRRRSSPARWTAHRAGSPACWRRCRRRSCRSWCSSLPAVAAYVATSADPSNSGVGWFRSVGVGASLWLLGHGVPAQVGPVDGERWCPLGVTVLALFVCYASARRSGLATRSAYAAGVGAYTAGHGPGRAAVRACPAVGCCARSSGWRRVSAVGLGAGLLARPEAPSFRALTRPVWSRVPGTGAHGAGRRGGRDLRALVLVAALVTAPVGAGAGGRPSGTSCAGSASTRSAASSSRSPSWPTCPTWSCGRSRG